MAQPQRLEELHRINYLTSEMQALYHQASLKLGVSDSVSMVLYAMYEMGGGCLLSEVYRSSGLRKQTVHSALRTLEAGGMLTLSAGEGRARRVMLTESGRELVERTAARLVRAEAQAFDSWSGDEVSAYLRLMERHLECLREEIEHM